MKEQRKNTTTSPLKTHHQHHPQPTIQNQPKTHTINPQNQPITQKLKSVRGETARRRWPLKSIAKPIGIHPYLHHAQPCHDLAVTHTDLHQTHHQSEQPRNPATLDTNTGDLQQPTKPSNTRLERTMTHNPL